MKTCKKCGSEIKDKAWTLCGRDYDDPSYFCSDLCRMVWARNPVSSK